LPRRPRTINVRDIAGAGEVDRFLMRETGISRPTAVRWRSRPDFPRRAKVLKTRAPCPSIATPVPFAVALSVIVQLAPDPDCRSVPGGMPGPATR
jgi:hypothetical protein